MVATGPEVAHDLVLRRLQLGHHVAEHLHLLGVRGDRLLLLDHVGLRHVARGSGRRRGGGGGRGEQGGGGGDGGDDQACSVHGSKLLA